MNFLKSYVQGIKEGIGIVVGYHYRTQTAEKPDKLPISAFEDITPKHEAINDIPHVQRHQSEDQPYGYEHVSTTATTPDIISDQQPSSTQSETEYFENNTFRLLSSYITRIQSPNQTKTAPQISESVSFLHKIFRSMQFVPDVGKINGQYMINGSPANFTVLLEDRYAISKVKIDFDRNDKCSPSSYYLSIEDSIYSESDNGVFHFQPPISSQSFTAIVSGDNGDDDICVSNINVYV